MRMATQALTGVLFELSEQVAYCYWHAEACARRADSERDPALRDDWLTMERQWMCLAHSFELTERVQRFMSKTVN